MNYLSMGLPSNYTSNPMYQQYMQMLLQSAQAQQAMLANQRQQQAAQQSQQAQQPQPVQQAPVDTVQVAQQPQVQENISLVADGQDDGKISFGAKVKNLGKGVVNFFKGMVCDENGKFSLKRTLTTAAIAVGATVLTIATGGAAAPFLVAAGATMGAVQVGKGAYKAATAKTDAEAEAAWQNIGSGAVAIAGSVAGAKGALKTAKVDVSGYKGLTGAFKATGKSFKFSADGVRAGFRYVKTNGIRNSLSTAKNTMGTNLKNGWESAFKSTNAKENAKAQMEAKYDARLKQNNSQIDKLMNELPSLEKTLAKNETLIVTKKNELASLEKTFAKNETLIVTKKNELASLLHEKTVLEARKTNLPETVRTVDNKSRITQLNKDITELKQELDFIKQTLPEADVSTIEAELASKIAVKHRLLAEQTTSGARQLQLERLEANKANIQEMIKNSTTKGQKEAFQKQLDLTNQRIAEVKQFSQIENAQQAVEAAKTKLPRYQSALEKINADIEAVKNNSALTAQEKATQLANLAKDQANATKLVNAAKTQITQGKRALHWSNVKAFEALNRQAIGYPTVAITGGGVVTQSQIDMAEAYARANGFNSAEEMQQYIDSMNAQQAAASQVAGNNAATATNAATQSSSNPYQMPQNIFAMSQMPMANNLGFNDLYVSPFPDCVV